MEGCLKSDKFKIILREEAVAYFKTLSKYSSRGAEPIQGNLSLVK
jgi:hypothetical protein